MKKCFLVSRCRQSTTSWLCCQYNVVKGIAHMGVKGKPSFSDVVGGISGHISARMGGTL